MEGEKMSEDLEEKVEELEERIEKLENWFRQYIFGPSAEDE
jgi:hypothetical protein